MTKINASQKKTQTTPLASSRPCVVCEAPALTMVYTVEDVIVAMCDGCLKDHIANMAEYHNEQFRQRFYKLESRGLIDSTIKLAGLMRSKSDVEALNPEAWKTAYDWREGNLFIFGPVGTGKTFLAHSALLRAFYGDSDIGVVCSRRFCKTMDRFDEGGGILKQWKRVDVLLVDDVDKANWNPERLSAFWELMDYRSTHGHTTFFTSNIDVEKLRNLLRKSAGHNHSLADAVLDRLKPCETIELKGKSLR